ncbi:hypothetical protein HN682_08195 [Candidatus Peregrinibacteria bacterium]|nr:hypothetical protein [Candidatus Peregrinibacteria bacterium]
MAKAIAQHETHYGADRTDNNICGIMRGGSFESYSSTDEALQDCMSVVEKYRPWTIYQMSRRYTTTQQDEWYNNVTYFYENLY